MAYKLNNGFTLAETIITLGITSLLITGIFSVFLVEQKALSLRSILGDDVRHAQTSLRRIEDSIRQGKAVVTSAVISGTTYTTGAHTIIIDTPAITAGGSIISGQTDRLVYTKVGTDLLEVSSPAANSARPSGTHTLAQNIQAFNVQTNGDPLTNTSQVVIYLSFPAPTAAADQVEGQVRATLRNK